MREKALEKKIVTATKKRGGIALKFTSPGVAGVPDRLILLPEGRAGFVEVKAPGRKPRPLQEHRMAQLRRLGFYVAVIDGPEEIGGVLDAIQAT